MDYSWTLLGYLLLCTCLWGQYLQFLISWSRYNMSECSPNIKFIAIIFFLNLNASLTSLYYLFCQWRKTTRELGESFNPKYNWGHHPIQVMMGLPGLSCRSTQFFSCHRFEAHFTEFQLTFSTLRATELVRIQSTAPKTSTFSFPNDVTEYKAIIIERIPIW